MSRRTRLVRSAVVVALVTLLSSTAPGAAQSSVEVFLFAPTGVLHVGDTVTAAIRVFESGLGIDAQTLSVYIPAQGGNRDLTVVRLDVGSYTATFQVQSTDIPETSLDGTGKVFLLANVTVGGATYDGQATLTVQVSPPALPPLELALSLSEDWIAPGSNVSVDATVYSYGVLRDADTLSVTGTFQRPYEDASVPFPIPMARGEVGQYHSRFRVPSDMPQDTQLWVRGEAALGASTAYASSATARVGWPHAYIVWYHVRRVAPAYALVDMLVANGTGWPVAGADVSLRYDALQSGGSGTPRTTPRWMHGTTGRGGAATFNLTYLDTWSPLLFPIQGNVSVGGRSQTYSGFVVSPDLYGPYTPSLCPSEAQRSYAPGETVRRTYHGACGYGTPFQNYSYYAYTSEGMVSNGSVQADAGGNFTLTFVAPAESVTILIDTSLAFFNDTKYSFVDGVSVADPSLLHVANLGIGQTVDITVDLPGAGGIVSLIPYNGSSVAAPEYSGWFPESRDSLGQTVAAVPGAPFHAEFAVPRFLPKDCDYRLLVWAGDPSTFHWAYTYGTVVHMANRPPEASAVLSSQSPLEGEAFSVNASGSADPDGFVLALQVDWGDGSSSPWSEALTATHVYGRPGGYTVTVRVQDDTGAQSTAMYAVTVDPVLFGVRATYVYLALAGSVAGAAAIAVVLHRRRSRKGPSRHGPKEGERPAMPPEPGHDSPPRGAA